MIKGIIISHPHLLLKHACGNHVLLFYNFPGKARFLDPKGVIKLKVITFIHLPNQEVLEYLQKYTLIFHTQKLYRVRAANSAVQDYLVLVQFDLVNTYF